MPSSKAIWLSLLLVPACAILGLAQTVPDPKIPPAPPDPQQDAKKALDDADKKNPPIVPSPELKDPTIPSQKLKEVLNVGQPDKSGPAGGFPVIVLRGRIISRDRPAIAMLEVGGKLYIVGRDSILPGPGNTTLRVLEVNNSEVRIEGPLKQVLSFR